MSPGIVILAAGQSARMGQPKQLLEYRGRPLLAHALAVAEEFRAGFPRTQRSPVAVVLGANAERIRPLLGDSDAHVVENDRWSAGMGASLKAGLERLLAEAPSLHAVIFTLCDQPLLSAATLRRLVEAQRETGGSIVASEYGGGLGVPALFERAHFADLLALDDGKGARDFIRAHSDQATGVPFPEGLVDIDTTSDYSRLHRLSSPLLT